MSILQQLGTAVAAGLFAIGSFFGGFVHLNGANDVKLSGVSSFNPVQAAPTTLSGSGITTSDTTINLTSLKTRQGYAIQTADIGGIGYATIDPGTVKEENISFTTITQNANGTAQITGVTRGLNPVYPYGASTTLQYAHSGGATVILSNSAPFYNQFNIAANTSSITGNWTFASTSIPKVTADTSIVQMQNSTSNLASVAYVNSVASSGAPAASPSIAGLIKIATSGDAFNSKTSSTYYFVPDASVFSGTPSSSAAYQVPVAQSGTIAAGWLPNPLASLTISTATSTATTTDNFNLLPAGIIQMYASSTAPAGWLLANGTSYATSSYPRLFAVIGYTYGGSTSTFNVPDMRGRFVAGPSSTLSTTLGATGGATSTQLSSSNLPSFSGITLPGALANAPNSGGATTYSTVAGSSGGGNSASYTGSDIPVSVENPYIIMNYIIKY